LATAYPEAAPFTPPPPTPAATPAAAPTAPLDLTPTQDDEIRRLRAQLNLEQAQRKAEQERREQELKELDEYRKLKQTLDMENLLKYDDGALSQIDAAEARKIAEPVIKSLLAEQAKLKDDLSKQLEQTNKTVQEYALAAQKAQQKEAEAKRAKAILDVLPNFAEIVKQPTFTKFLERPAFQGSSIKFKQILQEEYKAGNGNVVADLIRRYYLQSPDINSIAQVDTAAPNAPKDISPSPSAPAWEDQQALLYQRQARKITRDQYIKGLYPNKYGAQKVASAQGA
jgi:hypothetical protein